MQVSRGGRVRRSMALAGAAAAALALASPVTPTVVPSVANAAAAGPSCGSTTFTKETGGTWQCTFSDEFTGWSLNTAKWVPQTTAATGLGSAAGSGQSCFVASKNNISVSMGTLRLTARKESSAFNCPAPGGGSYSTRYSTGGVMTWSKFAQAYGRFEIRAKFPATTVAGLQSALWLWPKDHIYGAGSGEIDIAEYYTRYADRVIPFLHYKQAEFDPNITNNECLINRPQDFHTYLLEWIPGKITIKFDGKTCLVNDSWNPIGLERPAPFDHPYFINLTQLLGLGGTTNAFTASTPLPATTYVDYVRVWA